MVNYITKGSTITVGSGTTDIKAIIIEDFDIGVGDETVEKIYATDNTVYTFNKTQEDNTCEPKILCTNDALLERVFDSVYGAGTTVAGGTQWELRNAGGTVSNIIITSPLAGTTKLTWTAVNARGVSIVPTFKLQGGFEAKLKFSCDYWTMKKTT